MSFLNLFLPILFLENRIVSLGLGYTHLKVTTSIPVCGLVLGRPVIPAYLHTSTSTSHQHQPPATGLAMTRPGLGLGVTQFNVCDAELLN